MVEMLNQLAINRRQERVFAPTSEQLLHTGEQWREMKIVGNEMPDGQPLALRCQIWAALQDPGTMTGDSKERATRIQQALVPPGHCTGRVPNL